ncbi:MAG: PAS domain S-box protein [Porticoccaceae bacterium]
MKFSTRLAVILLSAFSLLIVISLFTVRVELNVRQTASQKIFAETLAQGMSNAIIQDVIDGERAKLTTLLKAITHKDNGLIEYIYVSGMDGHVFAHSYSNGFPAFLVKHSPQNTQHPERPQKSFGTAQLTSKFRIRGDDLIHEYELPLIAGTDATLYIGFNQTTIAQVINSSSKEILGLGLLLAILIAMVAWFVIKKMIKPINKFTSILKQYHSGKSLDFSGPKTTVPEIQLLSSVLQDVFDTRNRYENTLEDQKRHLEVTLNSIGDGVITTDAKGKITHLNPVAEQLTGWSIAEAKGLPVKTIFTVIDATTREPIPNPVEEVLFTGKTVYLSNHTTLISKGGTEYQIADSAAPIRSEENEINGMVLVFNDVSEQYHLRETAKNMQQKSQRMLDDMQTFVGLFKTDGTLTFVNKAPIEALGFTESEVLGKKLWATPWFDYSTEIQSKIESECETAASGTTSICEIYINTLDGLRLIELTSRPLFDQYNKVSELIIEGKDISIQHAALVTVQQQEIELKEILNSLENSVITIDQNGIILSVNRATEIMFGYNREEMLDQNISMLMPEPDKSQHDGYIARYLKTREKHIIGKSREVAAQRKNKTSFPIHLSIAELQILENNLRRFVGSCQDLTKIKLQQAQLQQAQKMDALGKLVGGIAHDYNNILGIILGYNELITMKYANTDGLSRYTSNISQAVKRGQDLTHRMLAFSKRESTKPQLVNIQESFNSQKEMLSKSGTSRVNIIYNFSTSTGPIWVDPSEFEDAILNLTINALHAMPDGGTLTFTTTSIHLSKMEATILGLPENDYVKLSITDTGSGIDEDTRSRIFEPFFSTKGTDNSGLGLSQVYAFMERAGGTVDLYSQPGIGTEFSLYFPRHLDSPPIRTLEVLHTSTPGDGERILVVDDEPALREVAKEILEIAGYRVLTATDGLTALSMLTTETVDLILSDVIMPNMDGYQLAEKIKQQYPSIKIQLASGFSDDRHITHADEALHENRISKPYTSSELLNRISILLGKGKRQ